MMCHDDLSTMCIHTKSINITMYNINNSCCCYCTYDAEFHVAISIHIYTVHVYIIDSIDVIILHLYYLHHYNSMIRNGLMIVASSSMTSMTFRRYLQNSMNHLMSWYDDDCASLSGVILLNCANLYVYTNDCR